MSNQPETLYDAHIRELNAYTRDPEYLKLVTYEDRAAFFEKQIGRRWEIDEAIYDEFLEMLAAFGLARRCVLYVRVHLRRHHL